MLEVPDNILLRIAATWPDELILSMAYLCLTVLEAKIETPAIGS